MVGLTNHLYLYNNKNIMGTGNTVSVISLQNKDLKEKYVEYAPNFKKSGVFVFFVSDFLYENAFEPSVLVYIYDFVFFGSLLNIILFLILVYIYDSSSFCVFFIILYNNIYIYYINILYIIYLYIDTYIYTKT